MNSSRKKNFWTTFAMAAIIFTALFSIIFGGAYAVKTLAKEQTTGAGSSSERLLPIYSVDRQDKKIAISFDCAWGVEYTDELLKTMQANDVKCTFFAVEFWVQKYPEYAKKIIEKMMLY